MEHTGDPSCGRQEQLLPAHKAFRRDGVDYLLLVNPARSENDRLRFGLFKMQRG